MKTKASMRQSEKVSVITISYTGHAYKSGEALVNKSVIEEIASGRQQVIYKGKKINATLSSMNYDGSETWYAILDKTR